MEIDSITRKISSATPDLSELHLAWFVFKDPSSKAFIRDGLKTILDNGGNTELSVPFLSNGAIYPVNEFIMPYSIAGDNENTADSMIEAFIGSRGAGDFERAGITLSDTRTIGYIDQNTIETVKKNIMEHGAVYISYKSDEARYNDTNHSYYSSSTVFTKNDGFHAVLLVGWNDNYSSSNFTQTPSTNGAWLVRNSWGSSWGDNGYFWMSYEQANTAYGMKDGKVFIVREASRDIKVSGHDDNGKTNNISSVWSANIFSADRHENLVRVGFYTTDNNAKYEVYVNNLGKDKPSDPGSIGTALISGDMPYAGYHTVYLENPVKLYKGDYYSITVKMILPSGYKYPTGAEGRIRNYVNASVNRGESFFAEGDEVPSVWQDGIDVENGPYNACIRGYTRSRSGFEDRPTITTAALPNAIVGLRYTYNLSAEGYGEIEWRAGRLPSGFALSREGVLSGKPERSGEYSLILTAYNDAGSSRTKLTLTVHDVGITSDRGVIPVPGSGSSPHENSTPSNEGQVSPQNTDDGEGGCSLGLAAWACVLGLGVLLKRK